MWWFGWGHNLEPTFDSQYGPSRQPADESHHKGPMVTLIRSSSLWRAFVYSALQKASFLDVTSCDNLLPRAFFHKNIYYHARLSSASTTNDWLSLLWSTGFEHLSKIQLETTPVAEWHTLESRRSAHIPICLWTNACHVLLPDRLLMTIETSPISILSGNLQAWYFR